jgi:3-oxoacyl-[acyl-carrier-protein] synthase-3
MPAFITAIAAFLPNEPVTNDRMESVLGMYSGAPSRVRKLTLRRNGIKSRYYAIDPETGKFTHTNAEMAAEAVRGLGIPIAEIDSLACGTSSSDQVVPGHAVMVHGQLGQGTFEAISMAGICASGLAAFKYAYLSVLAGQSRNAVAVGSEASSAALVSQQYLPETQAMEDAMSERPELAFEMDFLRWMLSDGAGAVRIQPEPRADGISLRIDWLDMFSYASDMATCMWSGGERNADGNLTPWRQVGTNNPEFPNVMTLRQDVRLLNENIIPVLLERPMPVLMEKHGLRCADVDWFLPHMSSFFFAEKIDEGLARLNFPIPREKWFTNLATRGNTGAASIFLMLEELMHSDRLVRGQRILCIVPESGRFSVGYLHLTVV